MPTVVISEMRLRLSQTIPNSRLNANLIFRASQIVCVAWGNPICIAIMHYWLV